MRAVQIGARCWRGRSRDGPLPSKKLKTAVVSSNGGPVAVHVLYCTGIQCNTVAYAGALNPFRKFQVAARS